MKLLIHSQTSTVHTLTFENGYVISSQIFIMDVITYPCYHWSTLQLQMLWCQWHHSIRSCKIDKDYFKFDVAFIRSFSASVISWPIRWLDPNSNMGKAPLGVVYLLKGRHEIHRQNPSIGIHRQNPSKMIISVRNPSYQRYYSKNFAHSRLVRPARSIWIM